jgi:SAM-dependent methyltransferase/FKBP-type peptidyl-prolyl cis-trans isomerase 2
MKNSILGRKKGEIVQSRYQPSDIYPQRHNDKVFRLKSGQLLSPRNNGETLKLRYGRFYPQGILKGLPGIFRGNQAPFRCTEVKKDSFVADLNHPLSGKEVRLEAFLHEVREKFEEHGGTSYDWSEEVAAGSGMQCRANGKPTDFFSGTPFAREDENDDRLFYQRPRFVNHLDDRAIQTISSRYGQLIRPGSRVLDLMSSWTTHLPEDLELESVVGLGMNEEELQKNPRLDNFLVHDLNRDAGLPFPENSFDAAICTASIEYLIHPNDVIRDAARVLKPGGLFVISFSNRWFPPKAIRIWTRLHDYERIGLVMEYFLQSEQFHSLETYSSRGWPRPSHDRHYREYPFSDPVYMICARTNS